MSAPRESAKRVTYLATAMKAPRIAEAASRLAEEARSAKWDYEDYLVAVLEREVSARAASGAYLHEARNVVLLGPPGTGKTHLASGLAIAAAHQGHRVLFASASEWVTRLSDAHRHDRLGTELARLRRYPLLVVDEVGYLPFEQEAANLFFQLVS